MPAPEGLQALPGLPSNTPPLPAPAPSPMVVALTGAPGTGVAELAAALGTRLDACVRILVLQHSDLVALEPVAARCNAARLTAAAPAQNNNPCAAPTADLILLTGLDVECAPHSRALQEAADAELRAGLAHGGLDYRVVYGNAEQRITQALRAIKSIANHAQLAGAIGRFDAEKAQTQPDMRRPRPAWSCEKCSDPECEHTLFTSLVGRSGSTTSKSNPT